MLRRSLTKLWTLLDNREAVFLLEVAAAIIASLLFAVAFLDATPVELLVVTVGLTFMVALGYALRPPFPTQMATSVPWSRGLAVSPYLLGLPFLALMAGGASPAEPNDAGRASLALAILLVVALFLNSGMHLARALGRVLREPAARRAYLDDFVSGSIFVVWAVLTASWLVRTV